MDERIGFWLYQSCGNRGSVGCGGVGGEWVGAWTRFWRVGWYYVLVSCESGFSV